MLSFLVQVYVVPNFRMELFFTGALWVFPVIEPNVREHMDTGGAFCETNLGLIHLLISCGNDLVLVTF